MKEGKAKGIFQAGGDKALALCLMLYALFQAVALITYHPLDPSFNTVFDSQIANKAGKLGALSSSFLLEFFGLASFLVIAFIVTWAVFLFKKSMPQFFLLRLASFMVAMLALSLFLRNIVSGYFFNSILYGGIVGHYLNLLMLEYISSKFVTLTSFVCFIIFASFAHSVDIINALRIARKIIKISLKYFARFCIISYNYTRRIIYFYSLQIQKRFFKKRVKDVDVTIEKPKEKHKKIVQDNTPPPAKTIGKYNLPKVELLANVDAKKKSSVSKEKLQELAVKLQKTLEDFGISGKILNIKPGPVVTLYELEPSPGIKSSRIIGLADDIARSMMAVSARIAVISGQNALGIELPNEKRETVLLRELIEDKEYHNSNLNLPLALGKNIGGEPVAVDLAKMPHLLVAGTTGSGKSVAVNTMILSLIYKLSPDECRFIMVDPKMLELSVYEGIPHLLSPVVTDPKKAVQALRWVVQEMENRYRLMSSLGVRNIANYNDVIKKSLKEGKKLTRTTQTGFNPENGKPIFEEVELDMKPLPYIVVIVDEMADLMLVAGKEIEGYIQRIAQMARAAGIHLVIATQRPSVDVITGVIKANFPTRISFQVTSKIDSRTILGEQGAEQLLGMGDMLYMHGGTKVTRVHGPFCSDAEVKEVVDSLKKQAEPVYINDMFNEDSGEGGFEGGGEAGEGKDDLYDQAVNIVMQDRKVSTSYIQRQLKIGYNRAANIVEEMEKEGLISRPTATGKREILVGEN